MDLFELLFIALFLLFPLLEGVLKRKRQSGGNLPSSGEPSTETEDEPWAAAPDEDWSAGPDRAEPASASDMVPEDLWAVLTGEERPVAVETEAPPQESWSVDEDEPESRPEPGSREYRGPEAYSLEEYEREPVTLERPLPSPDARHRQFHERVDAPRRRPARPRRGVARALASPDSLRQAFVLSEVLGPPKGLE